MDRLDAECLVSLAKRKEHFYASNGKHKHTKNRSKTKDAFIRELGENVSTEADSGFDTLCSTTIETSIDDEAPKRRVKIQEKISPPRRSPRNAQDKTSPSQHLSTSLGAIPKATNQILTRSRSLRLSGESSSSSNSPKQLNLSPPSPVEKKSPHYSPTPLDLAKASTSLISKFDSSLLNLDAKKNDILSSFRRQSGESTLDVSLCRSSAYGTSLDADDEESSARTISTISSSSPSWPMLQRDIPFGGFGKRNQRWLRTKCSLTAKEKGNSSAGRIVYSPGVFHGRERLDIVRRLNDMNAIHILDGIWSRLPAEDLGRALQVNLY